MTRFLAYSDDSATDVGDQRLFVAGYLNTPDNWAHFDVVWREELARSKPIEYLKMAEANGFRGQFGGWSRAERDEKVLNLARIIHLFEPLSYEVSLNRLSHKNVLTPNAPRLISPHFIATFAVVSSVSQYMVGIETDALIHFTFDQQEGVAENMDIFFDFMARSLPSRARRAIDGGLKYASDKDVPALQAADMLVWHLRREHEASGAGDTKTTIAELRGSKGHLVSAIDDYTLQRWSLAMEKMPAVKNLQSQSQWQKFRKNLRDSLEAGYLPPHGTRWRNFLCAVRDRFRS